MNRSSQESKKARRTTEPAGDLGNRGISTLPKFWQGCISAPLHKILPSAESLQPAIEERPHPLHDQTMVRIYARENATQRSKQVTALDGSVLAAMRWLARQLLGGISAEISGYGVFESEKAFECAQGNLQSDKGIGQDLIGRVLKDMPGMTRNSIGESLSQLKAAGDYARTLTVITPPPPRCP